MNLCEFFRSEQSRILQNRTQQHTKNLTIPLTLLANAFGQYFNDIGCLELIYHNNKSFLGFMFYFAL